ncbi:hypothetical protein L3Y34_011492 [Caenorhabditis briggsae]|uniref:Uncharacterized protein n=1 Tax=Caenorhabditis briggsae TaxID=6238 RepID=A0AAE9CUI0_CAEBR|nr:hypothetical protein L3Y34_011492 [Caenorhabditis briggsae]
MDLFEDEELDAENVISLRLDLENIKEFYNAPDRCYGTGKDILNTYWVFGCYYDPKVDKYVMSAIGEELENVRCDVTFSVVQPRAPTMERLLARPNNQRKKKIVKQFFREAANIPGGEWETVFTDERNKFENWALLGYNQGWSRKWSMIKSPKKSRRTKSEKKKKSRSSGNLKFSNCAWTSENS